MTVKRALTASVTTALVALIVVAAPGLAHEEKKLPARTLVQQAIALMRTQPEQEAAILDKIHDALEAKDSTGVDLAMVEEADEIFESGDLHEAWDLLEEAIGAAPHRVVASPNPEPRMPVPTASPMPMPSPTASPVLHEVALAGRVRAPESVAGPVLLGIAAVFAIAGAVIVKKVL